LLKQATQPSLFTDTADEVQNKLFWNAYSRNQTRWRTYFQLPHPFRLMVIF